MTLISKTAVSPIHGDPYTDAVFDAFQPVSEEHVRNVILKSCPNTCLLDPIPTSLFVECLDELPPAVTHIIRTSQSCKSDVQAWMHSNKLQMIS